MTKDGSTNTKAPVKQLSPPNFFKNEVHSAFLVLFHCLHRNRHRAKLRAKLHFSSAMNGIKLHETNEDTNISKIQLCKKILKTSMFSWVTTRLAFSVQPSSGKVLLPDSYEKNEACIKSLCSYRNAH